MKYISGIILLSAWVLLSACAGLGARSTAETSDSDGPPEAEESQLTDSELNAQNTAAAVPLEPDCEPPCVFPRTAIEDVTGPLAERLIFFDFDKSDIRPEYQQLLIDHGKYLASYTDVIVRLEGHTDERGSREYNLALGEQRAKAVRQILLLQGVPADNITVVSFGEELPLDLGHTEDAWSQNRRVELVYELPN